MSLYVRAHHLFVDVEPTAEIPTPFGFHGGTAMAYPSRCAIVATSPSLYKRVCASITKRHWIDASACFTVLFGGVGENLTLNARKTFGRPRLRQRPRLRSALRTLVGARTVGKIVWWASMTHCVVGVCLSIWTDFDAPHSSWWACSAIVTRFGEKSPLSSLANVTHGSVVWRSSGTTNKIFLYRYYHHFNHAQRARNFRHRATNFTS